MPSKYPARGPRRAREWFASTINVESLAAGAQTSLEIDSNVITDEKKGMTIVRILMDITWSSTVSGGLGRLAAGITLVNADAAAANAFPEPQSGRFESNWMWCHPNLFHMWTTNRFFASRQYDLRSKRMYRNSDNELHLVMNNQDATNPIDVKGGICFLVLKS